MIETQGKWGDLAVDSYLKDKTGTVWRVAAIDQGYLRCKNRENEWVTIAPKPADTPVTILTVGEADLIPMLRDKLGATVLGQRDHGTEETHCDSWEHLRAIGVPLDEFRGHLTMMHGIYASDIKTYAQLQEAHEAAHDPEQQSFGKTIPHTHTRRIS